MVLVKVRRLMREAARQQEPALGSPKLVSLPLRGKCRWVPLRFCEVMRGEIQHCFPHLSHKSPSCFKHRSAAPTDRLEEAKRGPNKGFSIQTSLAQCSLLETQLTKPIFCWVFWRKGSHFQRG